MKTKIKFCGLARPEDIAAANACLPDFVGFVFAESRRRVSPEAAAGLKRLLDSRIRAVGVFVNAEIEEIGVLCEEGVIDLVQLHGDEDSGYMDALRRRLKESCRNGIGIPIVKALSVAAINRYKSPRIPSLAGSKAWSAEPLPAGADFLLFDALGSEARGGGGRVFDWGLVPRGEKPFFLAGGLNAKNIPAAIELLHPYGVDVSSGIETGGFKDPEKMRAVIRAARGGGGF